MSMKVESRTSFMYFVNKNLIHSSYIILIMHPLLSYDKENKILIMLENFYSS